MAELESTVINTNVKQVKGLSITKHTSGISKPSLEMPPQKGTHHNPELWWPELLVPGFQQKWLSQGCWALDPSEVHVISSCLDWAGTFAHT